ncbi:ribosome biogenesis GTP-binding protein YihA/YsxC [Anaplasma capra]|uniref:ribosome biogenesis GTP-binding protein YihA/YsxC n=1 Tax=Anaplasma capra TaxID=1562740 RepID=UPI0021D596B9|nr:ribosome biogenesis GTP-binding protein YihA/YsxC [Anaplasma capra]MCU7611987.1 ribosome biogenesis GTP-binding protein YihA/YsxC [Anaplasma capra]
MLSKCRFVAGVQDKHLLPDFSVPEIAFAGRSNVGKSSLINAITQNKRNARVSSNPGSTRQINFYLNEGVLALVDLPGYGYSKASKEKAGSYMSLVEHYLLTREALQWLVLLIDSKVGLREIDMDFISWLEERCVHYSLVLTKIDRLHDRELSNVLSSVRDRVKECRMLLHPTMGISSKSGKGVRELVHEVSKCIRGWPRERSA